MKHVHLVVLGGTITMAPGAQGGIVPTLTGDDILRQVPELADIAQISVETPFLKPGAALTFQDIATVVDRIREAEKNGAHGVIVVQGTDTIDETSFLLDLLYDGAATVVVAGAMRGAKACGADGPANLLASVIVAADEAASGLGTLVVLNDEVHSARLVEKGHTALTSAFVSVNSGPVGLVVENRFRLIARPVRSQIRNFDNAATAPVLIVKLGLDSEDFVIRAADSLGYKGAVIEGSGAGHVPTQIAEAVKNLAKTMPVVLATRVPGGPVFRNTYAFVGSEIDLLANGVICAEWLSPHKARLVLALCLGAGLEAAQIDAVFRQFGPAG
ncbi:asparaginase [Aureimonas fodinaquatilis]|uniref:Asparaginase n=1 Tax=Aureimonas fodinaquatilis TaxID=2565783 RepID=A0A5B0E114_9HYPH|nr:asparaginase [Aureimonas fodinaquatilis]KAA0971651.1 asparaginase [Aureimonas fodinaquatilis]